MAYTTFTDALMQAKRASQLRGIPFSTRDVMNLQSGYMEGAGERVAGERSAALAEKSQTAQETNWASTLAQEKELSGLSLAQTKSLANERLTAEKELAGLSRTQTERLTQAQMDAQKSAATKALYGNVISSGAQLGGMAYLMAPAAAPAATGLGFATTGAGAVAGLESGGGMAAGAEAAGAGAGTAGAGMGAAGAAGATLAIEAAHQYITQPLVPKAAEALPGGEKEWGTAELTATRAAQGAVIGSVIPGVGTAIGAVVGGTVGFVESLVGGGK